MQQLQIDEYEYGCFDRYGGIHSVLIDLHKPLSTALHGWGNQLTGCPCSCRKGPMSLQRLSSKGLFGALLPCDGMMVIQNQKVQCLRHIHPWECALLHGAQTDRQWMPNLKLGLCGLGQMATPFHSGWIFGQWMHQVGQAWEIPDIPPPEQVLWALVGKALGAREKMLPHLLYSKYGIRLHEFVDSTHRLLFQTCTDALTPMGLVQPSSSPSEMPTELSDHDIPHEPLGIVDDGYGDIDAWNCPYDDCFICRPCVGVTGVECTPSPVHLNDIPHNLLGDISPTAPFTVVEEALPLPMISDEGGVPGFRRKRDHATAFPSDSEPPQQDDALVSASSHSDAGELERPTGFVASVVSSAVIPNHQSFGELLPTAAPVEETAVPDTSENESAPSIELDLHHSSSVVTCKMSQVLESTTETIASCNPQPESVGSTHHVVMHFPGIPSPLIVKVNANSTIGQIVAAECALTPFAEGTNRSVRVVDRVGQLIPWSQKTYPMQHLVVHPATGYRPHGCHQHSGPPNWFQHGDSCSRIQMLYRQESWVAHDEMSFYLDLLTCHDECTSQAPLVFTHLPGQLSQWVQQCLSKHSSWIVSAILLDNHWVPVVFNKSSSDSVQLFTTKEGFQLFRCEHQIPDGMQTQVITMPSLFSADCGFQTVGWIMRILTDPAVRFRSSIVGSPICPMTVTEAVTLRTLFEHSLWATPQARASVIPAQLPLGGALRETVEQSLHDILRSHGVPAEVADSRVASVLDKLGRVAVSKAMRSSKPWTELKHLANNVSPRMQLVLPSELTQVVKERVAQGKSFGDKHRKQTGPSRPSEPLQLSPEDISIPEGIFKMGPDQIVRQLALGSLCKDAQGVVVVTSIQAQPYLRLQQPMSQAGLALLILDHADASCIGSGCLVRFPAKFEKTGEPLLATARIVQLGCVEISRHLPMQQLKVDEVPNNVIRVLCFRDELPGEWTDFIGHPVKYIMDNTDSFSAQVGNESTVIDVWDRQFVNLRMERRQPKFADTFIVLIRVTGISIEQVLTRSGQHALYYEPRSQDGRSPHESYRVVWLPRVEKPDAVTSQQTSEQWSCLARNGSKFGLRIREVDAKDVHDQHKPTVPYLDGTSLNTFIVGPFGFGVTKQGLSKLFSQWKWAARPCQPKGKSTDGAGVLWEVQAQERPEYEVYTLEHGDVLVSMVDKKKAPSKPRSDILAPSRTLDVLKARSSSGGGSIASSDGILHHDPWANYQPSSKAPRVVPPASDIRNVGPNVEAIQASVDQKVAATLAQFEKKLLPAQDEPMDLPGRSRLDELEHRMTAMESTLQSQQIQHQQHQNHVAAQFTQLQHQVDVQGQSLQQHLDEKMQEQLCQIERLLGRGEKKSRQE